MTKEEQKQLVKIAEMYYLENKTQSEISRTLHIHRSTISRLLKLSRKRVPIPMKRNWLKSLVWTKPSWSRHLARSMIKMC